MKKTPMIVDSSGLAAAAGQRRMPKKTRSEQAEARRFFLIRACLKDIQPKEKKHA